MPVFDFRNKADRKKPLPNGPLPNAPTRPSFTDIASPPLAAARTIFGPKNTGRDLGRAAAVGLAASPAIAGLGPPAGANMAASAAFPGVSIPFNSAQLPKPSSVVGGFLPIPNSAKGGNEVALNPAVYGPQANDHGFRNGYVNLPFRAGAGENGPNYENAPYRAGSQPGSAPGSGSAGLPQPPTLAPPPSPFQPPPSLGAPQPQPLTNTPHPSLYPGLDPSQQGFVEGQGATPLGLARPTPPPVYGPQPATPGSYTAPSGQRMIGGPGAADPRALGQALSPGMGMVPGTVAPLTPQEQAEKSAFAAQGQQQQAVSDAYRNYGNIYAQGGRASDRDALGLYSATGTMPTTTYGGRGAGAPVPFGAGLTPGQQANVIGETNARRGGSVREGLVASQNKPVNLPQTAAASFDKDERVRGREPVQLRATPTQQARTKQALVDNAVSTPEREAYKARNAKRGRMTNEDRIAGRGNAYELAQARKESRQLNKGVLTFDQRLAAANPAAAQSRKAFEADSAGKLGLAKSQMDQRAQDAKDRLQAQKDIAAGRDTTALKVAGLNNGVDPATGLPVTPPPPKPEPPTPPTAAGKMYEDASVGLAKSLGLAGTIKGPPIVKATTRGKRVSGKAGGTATRKYVPTGQDRTDQPDDTPAMKAARASMRQDAAVADKKAAEKRKLATESRWDWLTRRRW